MPNSKDSKNQSQVIQPKISAITPKVSANSKNDNNYSVASSLLLPVAVFFSSLCLCAAMIVSSLILTKGLKDASITIGSNSSVPTSSTTSTTTTATTPVPIVVTLDQIKNLYTSKSIHFGDTSRKVLFVEVSDPSCPYCHAAGGLDPEVNDQFGPTFKLISKGGSYDPPVVEMRKLVDSGQASFVWIFYPGHGKGEIGTQALYCANEKGKFWDVHDLLMTNAGYNLMNNVVQNDVANTPKMVDFLKSAIDPSFLSTCITSGKYKQTLTDDTNLASKILGVNGTPGFFVNTTSYAGAYNWTDMKPTVDNALK